MATEEDGSVGFAPHSPHPPPAPQVRSRRRSWRRAEAREALDRGHHERVAKLDLGRSQPEPLEDQARGLVSTATHECKSLPTNPDERERRGEGWLRGYTTSCGHGHLGFSSSVFIAKNKCVVTILPVSTACLLPVPSTAAVSRRKWLAAQGTVAKLALGASCGWPQRSHTPRGVRAAHCPPAASARPTAARWPAEGWLYRPDWPAAPGTKIRSSSLQE